MVYDVIVVGGGQAGLAMGYYLKKSGLSFAIIDNHSRIGDSWRKRYDSLVLFTPRQYSSLPGLGLPGDPAGFPAKDEIADYLEQYAREFGLPVKLHTHVQKVYKHEHLFYIETSSSKLTARNIVVAAGPFTTPNLPAMANELQPEVMQLHSSQYKNVSQLKDGSVLVIGGGNSGAQIAAEISSFREAYFSVSQRLTFLPLTFVNKSIFWWFDKTGILKADKDSLIGKKVRGRPDPIFGYELKEAVKNGRIIVKGRTKATNGGTISFESGTSITADNVIWATGFKFDYSWIDVPDLLDKEGKPIQARGITNVEGLYFLGLPWQHRRGSALLLGVGEDAKYLNEHLLGRTALAASK